MSSEMDRIINNAQSEKQHTSSQSVTQSSVVSSVAGILKFFGISVIIIGIIAGIVMIVTLKDPQSILSYSPDPHPLRYLYGFSVMISGCIAGFSLVGFGEIIKLLTEIKQNTASK